MKLIRPLTVANLFTLEVVQKCQHFVFSSVAAGFSTFCAEHMSGDKRKVEVREARFGDYEAVVAIPGDFFRGRDYLPKMFHIFLQDKNSNCFVILRNGRIVSSFVLFIRSFLQN